MIYGVRKLKKEIYLTAFFMLSGFSLFVNYAGNDMVKISTISKYPLEIYLIHPIFTEIFMQFCGRILKHFPSAILIPIYSLIIDAMCMVVAKCIAIAKNRNLMI